MTLFGLDALGWQMLRPYVTREHHLNVVWFD